MADTRLMTAQHKSRPARAADRGGYITLRKAHAVFREGIDVRRWNLLIPLKAELTVADIVHINQQNIGPIAFLRLPGNPEQQTKDCDRSNQYVIFFKSVHAGDFDASPVHDDIQDFWPD